MAVPGEGFPSRWLRRYKFFFIIGILFLILQIFLAYKSFNIPLFNTNDYISDINNLNNNKNSLKIIDKSINSNQNDFKSDDKTLNDNPLKFQNINNQQLINNNNIDNPIIDDEDIHSNSNLYSKNKIKENSAIESVKNFTNSNNKKLTNLRLDELKFKLPCDINARESISAIHRAKTQECKKLIANITCDIQNGIFYPKLLPNYCPNDNFIPNRFLGCFKDEKNYRILSGYYTNFKVNNSPYKCIQMCLQSGFLYAGVQYS